MSVMTEHPPPSLMDMLGTGASYRQLDWWVRVGYLNPTAGTTRRGRTGGSGSTRTWSDRDWSMAYLMVRLTRSGLTPAVAHDMAARAVDHDDWTYETPDGVHIEWKVAPQ